MSSRRRRRPRRPAPRTQAELEAESEALVLQLMQQEQDELMERLLQAQTQEIERMQEEVETAPRQTRESLIAALRIAMSEAGDDGEDVDVDGMDYDDLLALGERLGDVKQERWRVKAEEEISQLEVVAYSSLTAEQRGEGAPPCLVCRCDFEDDESVRMLPCGHFFHRECVDVWLREHNTCITCKRSIVQ